MADKNDENISMSILEHGVDVYDGSNSGVGNINLCGEGLEAMEIGLEYQASHRRICRKLFIFKLFKLLDMILWFT